MKGEVGLPDVQSLRSLITGYEASQVIYVAARLGVADLLAEGPGTAEDLADALSVDVGALRRVLRGLTALGFLEQAEESRYATTEAGTGCATGCLAHSEPSPSSPGSVRIAPGADSFTA
jgi:hypothetical protein